MKLKVKVMKLKVKVLIKTAFFLAIGLLFIENLQAQRLISGGKPRESDVEGFDKSFCVNLSNDFKVCKSANYELEETKFLVLKNNKILTTTDAPYFSAACCGMDDFWAYHGDLDKDGSQEIIISSLEGISNGMGICSYSIHIFRDPTKFASEKPFTFPVELADRASTTWAEFTK